MVMAIMMMVIMVLDDGIGLGWPNSLRLSTKLPRSKFTTLAPTITIYPEIFNSWVWPKLGAYLPNWQVHPSWPVDKKGNVDASCGERFVAQRTRWEWASSNFALWKKYFSHAAQEDGKNFGYFDINCVSYIWKVFLCCTNFEMILKVWTRYESGWLIVWESGQTWRGFLFKLTHNKL